MENELIIDFDFKTKKIKKWFDDNYFIAMYDRFNNYVTCFDSIEETVKFFNKPFKYIVQALKNNWGIEYEHKKYRLFIFEKENEIEIESRGKRK